MEISYTHINNMNIKNYSCDKKLLELEKKYIEADIIVKDLFDKLEECKIEHIRLEKEYIEATRQVATILQNIEAQREAAELEIKIKKQMRENMKFEAEFIKLSTKWIERTEELLEEEKKRLKEMESDRNNTELKKKEVVSSLKEYGKIHQEPQHQQNCKLL